MVNYGHMKPSTPEKVITIFGSLLILFAIIGTIFNVIVNGRFIGGNPFGAIYYLQLAILALGGYGFGYLLGKREGMSTYLGVIWSLITLSLFFVIDALRISLQSDASSGQLFLLSPLITVAIAISLGLILKVLLPSFRARVFSEVLLTITFITTQLLQFYDVFYQNKGEFQTWNVVHIIALLATPLLIMAVAALIVPARPIGMRLVYGCIVGASALSLTQTLWLFRLNPLESSTNIFLVVISIIVILLSITFIDALRRSVRRAR